MTATFRATSAKLQMTSAAPVLTAGMANAVDCSITFDSDWDSLEKIAVFKAGGTTVSVDEDEWKSTNTVTIPWETLLTSGSELYFGIYGELDGETIIPTIWCKVNDIRESANQDSVEGLPETLSLWKKLQYKDVSTSIEKIKDNSKNVLKISFNNIDVVKKSYSSFDSVKLYFMMCGRRRGCRSHWYHPSGNNYVGYARMAGKAINPNDSSEGNFPAVPTWMTNSGKLVTEISLSETDLNNGHILIDPSTYFIPMIKPTSSTVSASWGASISLAGTRRNQGDMVKNLPIVFKFKMAINDTIVGDCVNTARFGLCHSANSLVSVSDNVATVSPYYTRID